jgi:drug/metabolite transporter (DMT)-like permease
MRRALTIGMVVAGVALMVISYFGLTAPWGAESVANSDPRLPFAPLLFVIGVMMAFGSALVYEMLPDRFDRK